MTTKAPQTQMDDPLALDRQVCFALAVANRAVLSVYRPLLEPMGLTHPPQYLVMLALWGKVADGGQGNRAGTATRFADAVAAPQATRGVRLITRTRSRADERQLDVDLTEAGVALRAEAEKIPPAVVAKLGVSLAELEELHNVLTRVNEAALRAGALDQ